MAGDVRVAFKVSCNADGSGAGLDGDPEDIAMLLISIQWEGMAKPVYLWAPAYRAPPAEGGGDDTADVAKSIADAVYSGAGMGDIPKEHVQDISILVDQDPDDPASRGKTTGLLILDNVTHFDLRCTEAKIKFTVAFARPDDVPNDVQEAEVPRPHGPGYRPIPDDQHPYSYPWETRLGPPKRRTPPRKPGDRKRLNRGIFPPWAKRWWRIPIAPRFRQWSSRSRTIRAYGLSAAAGPWGGGAAWWDDQELLRQQGRVLTQQVLADLKAQGVAAGAIDQQIIVYCKEVGQLDAVFGPGRDSASSDWPADVHGHPPLAWLIIEFDQLVGWPVTRIRLVPSSKRQKREGPWMPWECATVPPMLRASWSRFDASLATPHESEDTVEARPGRHAPGGASNSLPRENVEIPDGERASAGHGSPFDKHGRSDAP